MKLSDHICEGLIEQPKSRSVLIVVPNWPRGTMAFKFGSAIMSALNIASDSATLVQFAPERIFSVETSISKEEFYARFKKSGIPDVHCVEFRELNR